MSSHKHSRFSLDPLASEVNEERLPVVQWSLIGLLVIVGLLLETTVFSSWKFFGASPTFAYVAVAAVGYYAGANTGAIFGFCAGIGVDFFYRTPFGISALALMICGIVIGTMQTGMIRPTPIAIPFIAFLVSFCGNIFYILLSIVVGYERFFGMYSLKIVFFSSLINAVASPIIFMIVKAIIGVPAWKNR